MTSCRENEPSRRPVQRPRPAAPGFAALAIVARSTAPTRRARLRRACDRGSFRPPGSGCAVRTR
ncbi:hypothetical protein CKJ67_22375 [Mycobacterium intracellulare]|nr:hypothetical protein CKJ67_22375 [Mycobacterium intracellulare]ASX02212.1 hypothetical protein CKJ58_21305 [Mycobacterium intracellulare subsp. chimaera]PBA19999.1 hypothetical protein CKJ68_22190 [Mycobacterium intracellulare]PBA29811.1 hypothetical protein CKJ65_21200 [Mycobacterium intracellulare]PBA59346.1 hypothetical protein CKJ56_21495 [Mycobacterium intracellulare subsp. chimaera]